MANSLLTFLDAIVAAHGDQREIAHILQEYAAWEASISVFGKDFTSLMEDVARENGADLPDSAHSILGKYIGQRLWAEKQQTKRAQELNATLRVRIADILAQARKFAMIETDTDEQNMAEDILVFGVEPEFNIRKGDVWRLAHLLQMYDEEKVSA